MKKKRLTKSLLFYDIMIFIFIFIAVNGIFELIIKKMMFDAKIEKINDKLVSMQYDFATAMNSLEEKSVLPYKDNFALISEYLKLITLKRAPYDDSMTAIILPDDMGVFTGIKQNIDIDYDIVDFDYDTFLSILDRRITVLSRDDYNNVLNNLKNLELDDEKKRNTIDLFHSLYRYDDEKRNYNLVNDITDSRRKTLYNLFFDLANYTTLKYNNFEFEFLNKKYVGVITLSDTGVRLDYNRDTKEKVFPLLIVADKKSDFNYLINLTRNFFIGWLIVIIFILGTLKFRATFRATRDIESISSMLMTESNNIKTKGEIGSAYTAVKTKFLEVDHLNEASLSLNDALLDLKNVVLGVTNEEFFIGTITKDKKVIEQHDVFMTIMFLDIEGFTGITEKHKKHAMKIGISIFSEVGLIIKKYGGEIRKLLGDAVLITFKDTSDSVGHDSCLNAFLSSIEILKAVEKIKLSLNRTFNKKKNEESIINFNFRIGMDAGVISEGLYGTTENFEYGIIGDAVNTASRFEGINKQYGTHILFTNNIGSEIENILQTDIENDKDYVKNKYNVRLFDVDKARPKGKVIPNTIYTVISFDDEKALLLGNDREYSVNVFDKFSILIDSFHESIAIWKKYFINEDSMKQELYKNAVKSWKDIIKEFVKFYYDYHFPPALQYIRLMLTVEEFDRLKIDHKTWLNKIKIDFREPNRDWLDNEYLCRELAK